MNYSPDTVAYLDARTRDHVRLLSIFHYVVAGLTLLGLAFVAAHYWLMRSMMSMPSMQAQPNPPPQEFMAMFFWMYVVFGVVLIAGGILNFLAARNLRRHRARTFCMVVAGLNCLQMPLGTVLGVFTLVTLAGDSARRLFERNDGAA